MTAQGSWATRVERIRITSKAAAAASVGSSPYLCASAPYFSMA